MSGVPSVLGGLDMTMPGDITFGSGTSYFGENLVKGNSSLSLSPLFMVNIPPSCSKWQRIRRKVRRHGYSHLGIAPPPLSPPPFLCVHFWCFKLMIYLVDSLVPFRTKSGKYHLSIIICQCTKTLFFFFFFCRTTQHPTSMPLTLQKAAMLM